MSSKSREKNQMQVLCFKGSGANKNETISTFMRRAWARGAGDHTPLQPSILIVAGFFLFLLLLSRSSAFSALPSCGRPQGPCFSETRNRSKTAFRVSQKHTPLPNLCHTRCVTATTRQGSSGTTRLRTTGPRDLQLVVGGHVVSWSFPRGSHLLCWNHFFAPFVLFCGQWSAFPVSAPVVLCSEAGGLIRQSCE